MPYSLKFLTRAAVVAGLAAAAPLAIAQDYNPQINPADFSTTITNPLFNLPVGKKLVYEAKTEDGEERIVIEITGATKTVMGVETLVYHDRVFLNGQLIEDTRDYLAQDKEGNVWYFGEDVDNFENGKLKDHAGAWLAGIDGAKPGIWFPANPVAGDEYRMEFYPGEAEDMQKIVAVGETVTTKLGTFENCVRTLEWTPLEPDAQEENFYCPAAGGAVLGVNLQDGQRDELAQLRLDGPNATDDDGEDDDKDDDDDHDDDDDDDEDDDD